MAHLITAMSHTHFVRRCVAVLGQCTKTLCFTGQRGPSRQSTAVIVRLVSAFARSEAVYDMHFVPLRAILLHLYPEKCSVSDTWMHLSYERNMAWAWMNMNVIIVWAWMLW